MTPTPDEYIVRMHAACDQARASVLEARAHRQRAERALRNDDADAFEKHVENAQAAITYSRQQLALADQIDAELDAEHPITDKEPEVSDRYSPDYLDPNPDENVETTPLVPPIPGNANALAKAITPIDEHPVCIKCGVCLTCGTCICEPERTHTAASLAEAACDLTDAILEFSGHTKPPLGNKIGEAAGAIFVIAIAVSVGLLVIAAAVRLAARVAGVDIQ